MKRYCEDVNHPPHMHNVSKGEWVRYEDVQEMIRTLFDAKTLGEWMNAVAALGNFRGGSE